MKSFVATSLAHVIACTSLLCGCIAVSEARALARETQRLPDIAAPPGGHAFWIARSMRLNGVPMTIKRFDCSINADDVLHHYERQLRTSSNNPTHRSQTGEWRVLAVKAPTHYVTIRARDTALGTHGTIAVSPPLERIPPRKVTRFPHPSSAQVVNLQQYDDSGIEAEHISFLSRRSVAIEAHEFERLLNRDGWQLLRSERASHQHGGYVIEAQKAAALAIINLQRIARSSDTSIMVVWRKA